MGQFMLGGIIGVFLGVFIGFGVASICKASSSADEKIETTFEEDDWDDK